MTTAALPSITFRLTGVSPLLLHNSRQFLDATCKQSKDLKALTSKKKKTDEDLEKIARMEWLMGLYLNEKSQPIIPGENIERMIIEGARKNKKGQLATAGVIAEDAEIVHEGPSNIKDLIEDPQFADKRPVVVQRNRIMRCRPIFRTWVTDIKVQYIPDIMNKEEVVQAMEVAGRFIGLGDYRPKFGRFTCEVVAA